MQRRRCIVPTVVCTVTGNTVIDFFNRALTIPDRCAYNLISPGTYNLTAVFQERRRKDVSFLDQLIISDSDDLINLQQGGRVLFNGELLSLNTTPQEFMGVELTKDQTGVTAKFPVYDIQVLFDGNTAHVTAPMDEALSELCGNPSDVNVLTTLSAEKSSGDSAPDCETVHNDIPDPTIDCGTATASCNRMNDAPFTACHTYIDPLPYVTACMMTSCNYTDVDGLICQYLEAYAMSCYLKDDITLEDWRSAAGCDVVLQHSCRDQYCSYFHEFCGVKLGVTRCLCRALFAETYTATNSLGNATVCTQNSATLSLAACLLWDKGIDYTSLHLNDPACEGDLDNDTNIVTFSFESSTCGTEVMLNDTDVLFKNAIMTRNTSLDSQINRHHEVEIDFSCYHMKPAVKTMSFHIADSSVVQNIESGVWNYTVTMKVYSDPAHQDLLEPDLDIMLNQKLWLEVTTDGLDDMVALVIDSCWATDQQSPNANLKHDLIDDGCPSADDDTVGVERNGLGTSVQFSFSMFEFYAGNDDIYLHCQMELCPIGDLTCAPECTGSVARKRRSTKSEYADGNPALITMAWKK
ncbi:alpha-tectorin-like [Sebastes fasciatus]|uniref:alpha-tectorin-like n=1 Tax=Sebastes fasciatus TaxID=394691 RepID=UPI003D9E98E6